MDFAKKKKIHIKALICIWIFFFREIIADPEIIRVDFTIFFQCTVYCGKTRNSLSVKKKFVKSTIW